MSSQQKVKRHYEEQEKAGLSEPAFQIYQS